MQAFKLIAFFFAFFLVPLAHSGGDRMNNGGGIAESRLHWFGTNRLEAMRACQLDLSCGQNSGRAALLGVLQQIESHPSSRPTSPSVTLHFASWDQKRREQALRHSGSLEWDTEPSIGSPIEFDLSAIQPEGIPLESEVLAEKLWNALIYQASSATPTSVRHSWAAALVRKTLQKTIELSPETFSPLVGAPVWWMENSGSTTLVLDAGAQSLDMTPAVEAFVGCPVLLSPPRWQGSPGYAACSNKYCYRWSIRILVRPLCPAQESRELTISYTLGDERTAGSQEIDLSKFQVSDLQVGRGF